MSRTVLIKFQEYVEAIAQNKTAWGISRKITVYALGAQMLNVSFLKTCFTDQMNFIVVQYLATNSGLLSNC
jgi:hypothetical protein